MDIKQLVTFIEVAKQKSFTRTAELLFLTQPTVSNHVKSLEQELGVHLFIRSKKQITLTNAGLLFHKYAKNIVSQYEQMQVEMEKYTEDQDGHLRLFASSVPIRHFLPTLMQKFHEAHPHVTFSITDTDSRMVVDNLLMGDTDFGFTGARYSSAGLKYKPVFQDQLVLITQNGSIQPEDGDVFKVEELLKLPIISRAEGSGTRKTVERSLQKLGIPLKDLNIIAFVDDTKSIVEMVSRGLGNAIVSNLEVKDEIASKQIVAHKVEEISNPRDFYFVYHENQKNSAVNRMFSGFVRQYFEDEGKR